ncbi:Tic22 family protein, partial [Candidatus Cyanaurora vandensis]
TDKQVSEKLNNVPAFAIVNKEGKPLIVPVKEKDAKEEVGVIPVFTDGDLASKNYAEFQKNAPDASKLYQIIPIRLGEAFDAARTERQNKESKIRYYFQPDPEDQKKALALAKQTKSDIKEFPWIPVFFLGKGGQPVVFTKGSEQSLPFFFSEDDLQKQWQLLKKDKPDMAIKAEIQVASLYQILDFMLDAKNDKEAQAITFIPAEDALKYVDTIQKNLPSGFAKDGAPATTPVAPKPNEAPKP